MLILILFLLLKTQNYVSVVKLSARDHQQLSKRLSEGFKRSVYWNKYKTKRERKKTRNECKCFHKSNLENIGLNRLFVLVYSNQGDNAKRFKTWRYYLPKRIIDNYNIINEKKNNDQPIDSYIKQYKEIRKLRTGQGEDYTIGCLLDYDYIKNYYRLRAVNLTRQKDADPNSAIIQQ